LVHTFALRNTLGEHIGTGYFFHASEGLENLPHGGTGEDESVEAGQAELEERLQAAYEESERTGQPFGILWITVDQAENLRRTHGTGACDAMLKKVQRVLVSGLTSSEEIGRWGENEFLILSHERFTASLAAHAQMLAGLARTTDFRWWGDRISLTVSIGAAQAGCHESLADLLERAKSAMKTCIRSGGNRVALAPWRPACLPS
jgi:diguanylate cyclase (GGDEF)-like protein